MAAIPRPRTPPGVRATLGGTPKRCQSHAKKKKSASGDRLMESLGFAVIRFSQPRNTMQTAGIPDRRYYRAPRPSTFVQYDPGVPAYVVWWEAKREGGKQSPAQRAFQELVESCGEAYVVGPVLSLIAWCEARGLILKGAQAR